MPDYSAFSLEELDRQLNLLKSMDEVSDALDEYAGNLKTGTGADVETKLSDDTSVDFLLGKLKDALTGIEGIKEPYEKLTGPAGTVDKIASGYKTVNDMLQAVAKAESLSGQEQAEVLGQIVDGMPGLASALTGLGSLNPVIGSFLLLYGKAIESAAVVIGIIEARNQEIVDIIRSRGELDVEAILALQEADRQAREEARQALADEYDRALDAYLSRKAVKDETERRIASRYSVRTHADATHAALAAASRFPTRGTGTDIALSDHPDIDEGDLADLDEWVKAIEGDIVSANQRGDAERARELTDAKYEVLDHLAPIKKGIIERLEGMEHSEAAGGKRTRGTVKETVPTRRWWWALVGGLVLLAIIAGVVLLSGSDPEDPSLAQGETTTTEASPTTTTEATTTTTESPFPEGETFTSVNGWTIVFRGPNEVVAGENINLEWCAFDPNGAPAEGEALGSVGPDGNYTAPEASHGSAPFVDGCASIELSNNIPAGGTIGIAGFFEEASFAPMDFLQTEVG